LGEGATPSSQEARQVDARCTPLLCSWRIYPQIIFEPHAAWLGNLALRRYLARRIVGWRVSSSMRTDFSNEKRRSVIRQPFAWQHSEGKGGSLGMSAPTQTPGVLLSRWQQYRARKHLSANRFLALSASKYPNRTPIAILMRLDAEPLKHSACAASYFIAAHGPARADRREA
jgi:hypothetical protein